MGESCPPPSSYAPEKNIYAETFQTRRVVTDRAAVTGVNVLILPGWRPRTDCRLMLHIAVAFSVNECRAFSNRFDRKVVTFVSRRVS